MELNTLSLQMISPFILYPFLLGHKGQTFYDWCQIFLIPCQNGTEVKS